jgi:hypothetical protein
MDYQIQPETAHQLIVGLKYLASNRQGNQMNLGHGTGVPFVRLDQASGEYFACEPPIIFHGNDNPAFLPPRKEPHVEAQYSGWLWPYLVHLPRDTISSADQPAGRERAAVCVCKRSCTMPMVSPSRGMIRYFSRNRSQWQGSSPNDEAVYFDYAGQHFGSE